MDTLTVQDILKTILNRANEDGIEAARDLYSKMFDNEHLSPYKSRVDAELLLQGRDELIVNY